MTVHQREALLIFYWKSVYIKKSNSAASANAINTTWHKNKNK